MGANASVSVRDLQENALIKRLVGKKAVSEGDAFWEEVFKFSFKMPTDRLARFARGVLKWVKVSCSESELECPLSEFSVFVPLFDSNMHTRYDPIVRL